MKVNNLSSFYRKRKLNDISINVKEGEIVGLLGPNGTGKTTCFQCITGPKHVLNIKLNDFNITNLPTIKTNLINYTQETSIFRGLSVEQYFVNNQLNN